METYLMAVSKETQKAQQACLSNMELQLLIFFTMQRMMEIITLL